jgi:hypothetical protein
MAVEQAKYTVVVQDGGFELRDYAPHVVAETVVAGEFEQAGNRAFSALFRYISGGNRSRSKLAMTAPVSQASRGQRRGAATRGGERIAMTAPVAQQAAGGRWAVSFTMPAAYSLETLPQPSDPRVLLRQLPARRVAAVRYSGTWSEKSFLRHKTELESWVAQRGLRPAGDVVWARYNPPFSPWFVRRNEILVEVEGDEG